MTRLLYAGALFVALSGGAVVAHAQEQDQGQRHVSRATQERTEASREFEAMAPATAGTPSTAGNPDPLDYHLGYFRNF